MRLVPLLEVASLVAERVTEFEGSRPYIATGGLNDFGVLSPEPVTFANKPSRADLVVAPGDVCFARMQGTKKVMEFDRTHSALILSTGFAILRPDPRKLDSSYLRQWLNYARTQAAKDRLCSGATQKAITNEKIASLTIPIPGSVSEQHRIAETLDKADALRTKRREIIAKLDLLLQSAFLDMFGDPKTNPKGLRAVELGALIVDGPQNGIYKPSSEYGSGTPILRIDGFKAGDVIQDLPEKRLRLSATEVMKYRLRPDDLVINRVNSPEHLGKPALVGKLSEATVFESNMMRMSIDSKRASATYLLSCLLQENVRNQISRRRKDAVNQSSINQTDVSTLTINLPPIRQQEGFAAVARAIARQRDLGSESALRSDLMYDSLSSAAFSG